MVALKLSQEEETGRDEVIQLSLGTKILQIQFVEPQNLLAILDIDTKHLAIIYHSPLVTPELLHSWTF